MKQWKGIPVVTAEEMARVDDFAITEFGLSLFSMMENAGRLLATLAGNMLRGFKEKSVVCLIGPGHNGGGGLVAGRHLANWGANVEVVNGAKPDRFRKMTAHQYLLLQKMKIPFSNEKWTQLPDLFIDALLGYGGSDNPREPMATLISKANETGVPILALDIPSGLNATSGVPQTPCVRATVTMTLALPKTGLITKQAESFVGSLYLADIGIPSMVYHTTLGIHVSLFHGEMLIRLE